MAEKTECYPIKLVRDEIPTMPNVGGAKVEFWAVGSTTKKAMLRKKLAEEVGEYLVDGDHRELVDLLEVIEALAVSCHGMTPTQLRLAQKAKRQERGGFRKGLVMYVEPRELEPTDAH